MATIIRIPGGGSNKINPVYLSTTGTSDVIKTSGPCYAHICANIYYSGLSMYFEGSNDNSTWTVIERREGGGGGQYMDVWNWTGTGYKYYRLRVTASGHRFSACLFG